MCLYNSERLYKQNSKIHVLTTELIPHGELNMGRPERAERKEEMKKVLVTLMCLAMVFSSISFAMAEEKVVIEFAQWWENELPEGAMAEVIADFEAQHPNIEIKLVTNPYVSTHDAVITGAATGTMADVCGLDGAWVYDLNEMGALMELDTFLASEDKFSPDDVTLVKVDGTTYMMPVVVFSYHVYANKTLLEQKGITELPTTMEEFKAVCEQVSDPDNNIYGWISFLSEAFPSSVCDSFMSWAWASGGRLLDEDGKASFADDPAVIKTVEFYKECYEKGYLNPGLFSFISADMQDTFANGYAAFMVSTCSTINTLRQYDSGMEFVMTSLPVMDGYEGQSGVMYAPWGLGIAANTEHPEEAREFVSYLLSADVDTKFAGYANGFPGNTTSEVVSEDEAFVEAYKIVQENYLINETQGLPAAVDLYKSMVVELQLAISGEQTIEESLQNAEDAWNEILGA